MTLGCRAFFREFSAEFKKDKTRWEKNFYKRKFRTAEMLGTGKSREKGDFGIFGRIGKKFGYDPQAEWMRIDQIWYYWLPKPEKWDDAPWKTDVAIEHGNEIDDFEYTIFKFGEVSAPLKVGVFYPDEEDEDDLLRKCSEMILKQVSAYPGGVYLIIFGFLDEDNGVHWHGYEIDFKGNTIQLH